MTRNLDDLFAAVQTMPTDGPPAAHVRAIAGRRRLQRIATLSATAATAALTVVATGVAITTLPNPERDRAILATYADGTPVPAHCPQPSNAVAGVATYTVITACGIAAFSYADQTLVRYWAPAPPREDGDPFALFLHEPVLEAAGGVYWTTAHTCDTSVLHRVREGSTERLHTIDTGTGMVGGPKQTASGGGLVAWFSACAPAPAMHAISVLLPDGSVRHIATEADTAAEKYADVRGLALSDDGRLAVAVEDLRAPDGTSDFAASGRRLLVLDPRTATSLADGEVHDVPAGCSPERVAWDATTLYAVVACPDVQLLRSTESHVWERTSLDLNMVFAVRAGEGSALVSGVSDGRTVVRRVVDGRVEDVLTCADIACGTGVASDDFRLLP